MSNDSPGPLPPLMERTIGNTTYIITAQYSKTATENVVEKIRRIILNNLEKVS